MKIKLEKEVLEKEEVKKNIKNYSVGTVTEIENQDKFNAIKELIHKASDFENVKNLKKLERSVIECEKAQCTGFGHGVAIAHCQTKEVKKIVIVLGISNKGIRYNSPDGKLVNIMFMIASPPDKPAEYIYALSTVARMLSDECFKNEILSANCIKNIKRKVYKEFKSILLRY